MPDSDPGPQPEPLEAFIVRFEGFEGPLDLLLELARSQKVDLANVSILALVEQYLAIVEGARRVRLELAADWLVMAAWLAWLKSRLLLPEDETAAEEGEIAADVLAARLQALEAIREGAAWLGARPQLGHDVFPRGAPEDFTEIDRSRLRVDLTSLLTAYLAARRRSGAKRQYRPKPMNFWSVQQALERLTRLLGATRDWTDLAGFLPPELPDSPEPPLARRAALSSTLLAGLELARDGQLALRQEQPFGPIQIRPGPEPEPDHE
ncbi:MAG TPA: ScpA family protein [Acidiphilium sp.]|jgi:segregation and condensation protein A|uniref:segregation and condensation protein A n=1 Tax=unclassified Acidiphilium TaxID=2617493 RepID=UPI000BDC2B2C|nr:MULTISPECIES: ScpA family protein [unclassified Acidiphilium]OYV57537.1 MAG: segregation/condensation protein A [Acidiphilium sp. 20-67-58]OYV86456.1 MAG: segregation/condensation protein A [Acidiphilium sp. 21-68-69]HQT59584.1 ScpA family protein [Acidiphilium sp.]HQU10341.1 ScpA family protein [Acidiphilium sp.]